MNMRASFFRAKEELGKENAYKKFIFRNLTIIGFGATLGTADGIFEGGIGVYIKISFVIAIVVIILALAVVASLAFKRLRPFSGRIKKVFFGLLALFGLIDLFYSWYGMLFLCMGITVYTNWGVLQAIGASSLIVLLFIEASTLIRAIAAVSIMVLYALLHSLPGMMENIDWFVQGGFFGNFSWASMILVFTVFADFYYHDRNEIKNGRKSFRFLLAMLVVDAFGCFAACCLFLSRGTVNSGFCLLTIAIAVTLFGLIALTENYQPQFKVFVWWGRNPIMLFLFQYLFTNIPLSLIPGTDKWTLLPASIYGVALMSGLTWYVWKMDRENKLIRL